ncbi:hypothetical protein [Mycolicibacterium arenosum]|uniref:Uncharacterized protein n=1 Tax=Mycolicibacterium arenosum TaxID=2952157 RepID=A0ABT1M8E9_9MYCO|nr:hypothetical protein [Mycolicibacterium sp. CAU 1645]MCP9275469.1 hypothetical protein [Mycolicibacterium sp. CAU 1645]
MTLLDPRDALADQNSFIGYLLGIAGLADTVRTLATDESRALPPPEHVDDFVYALLGIAGLGDRINGLSRSGSNPEPLISSAIQPPMRWLR